MLKTNQIILTHEVRSRGKILPAGITLLILRSNESVARCVDAQGDWHILRSSDYICRWEADPRFAISHAVGSAKLRLRRSLIHVHKIIAASAIESAQLGRKSLPN